MKIPNEKIILKTNNWIVNHRIDSSLPGYVILQSSHNHMNLCDLSNKAIQEMGILMGYIEKTLKKFIFPKYIYIGRYGHTPNTPFHFHFIPVSQWILNLFWSDERYRILGDFGKSSESHLTDGAELTFFIWREFCEKEISPPVQGISVDEIIAALKIELKNAITVS
ncbi:hypothetical protein ACP179_22255 [Xenorhabdus stockiae]|uniref:hypothetical protein n=1 Tax=Xenorhabdus stockiae TaxID=351614 RepID=UPI003CF52E0C